MTKIGSEKMCVCVSTGKPKGNHPHATENHLKNVVLFSTNPKGCPWDVLRVPTHRSDRCACSFPERHHVQVPLLAGAHHLSHPSGNHAPSQLGGFASGWFRLLPDFDCFWGISKSATAPSL